MSWMVLRLSRPSPGRINQKFHKSGGVVRTKEERRPDEGNRKVLFVGMCASSGRRSGVVRTKETEIYFFQLKECRPDHSGGSSGRRGVVRTTRPFRPDEGRTAEPKTYGKNVFFGGKPGYTEAQSYNPYISAF